MLDPVLFSIDIGITQLTVRWYGLLIVLGAVVAASYAAWYVKRNDEDPNIVWDALIWLLISGIVGARIWYVVADIIGGNSRYLDDPLAILRVYEGGLNILGGLVLAALVGWFFAKRNGIDFWLMADAVGPAYLIGQAIGRLGNFINQELYGPPTDLPWGIPIDAAHRIAPWNDMAQFPVETTRFHPTFAYELIWNLIFAALLIYLIVKKGDRLRTGVIAASALVITGVGRALIETSFRPDQPSFFGLGFSTSLLISVIFALIGLFVLLVRLGKIQVSFMAAGSMNYTRKPVRRPPVPRKTRQRKT